MKISTKRKKIMAALGAVICSVTAVVPAGAATTAATKTWKGTVTIPKLGYTRDVYDGPNVQAIIDECVGAAIYRSNPGVLQLAAHRTQCGSRGFGGVERLRNKDKVTVTIGGKTTTYSMFAEGVGYYEKSLPAPPIGTQLTLMASYSKRKGDDRIYLKYFQPDGIPKAAGYGRRKVSQGKPVCVTVPGARKNDWVFVNVTPVRAQSAGYATIFPAGNTKIVPDPRRAPSTSTVNWTSASPQPNTTLVQAGNGSKVCAAVFGKPVDLIFDALAIGSSSQFTAAQRRLLDTRRAGGTVTNSSKCFSVPNAANKWAVLNLTAIGRSPGWGRLQRRGNPTNYSNVNFNNGDIDANMVVIKVPGDGTLCYYSGGRSDAVVDLIAIARPGTFIDTPWLPKRSLDLRKPTPYIVQFNASGSDGVNNGWAFINAIPIPKGTGHSRLYDCQLHPETGSDVNYGPRVDPNVAVVKTGPSSQVCIATTGPRPGWVLDTLAVAQPNAFRLPGHRRIFDSRW